MINFLRSLLPQYTPAHIAKKDELTIIRERIFQGILLIVAVVVIVAYLILISQDIIQQNWSQALSITISAALVLSYAFVRRVPFFIRVSIFIVMLLFTGIITFNSSGTAANAKVYLVSAAVLAAVFLGRIAGSAVITIGLGISLYFTVGKIDDWISDALFFVVVGSLASTCVGLLVNFLQNTLKKQRELTQDLEYERLNMAERVKQSVSSLERRLIQIRTAAEITRAINSNLDPQLLLQQVVDLIQERFELYYVGLFLLDDSRKYALLQAGTGQAGKDMIAENYRLQVAESSMIGWSIIFQKPRIAQDVGQETVRFKNPFLPLTRSEMALPFISRGNSLGAVTIQSVIPNAFDENDILILQGIVDALSVAFENARLFQQSRQDLEEIRALNREYLQKSWAEVSESYGDIQYEYTSAIPSPSPEANPPKTIEMPITLRDQPIGQISIETDQGQYTRAQLEFVEAIALQTALALDNARLIQKTQRSAIQEQTLNQISAQFSQALGIEEILKAAVKEIGRLPTVSEVSVHLIDESKLALASESEKTSENLPPPPSKRRKNQNSRPAAENSNAEETPTTGEGK